ncbi:hypothetical protein K788_0006099 (plasmid) [Paraburkholderia caribensis MBA4]|uniref:Uncharacterized protein n=1 Tax=Paraburkholderia caribensis MBA4 TaxID=1323664 RepID=A0A0N7JWA8_9BURK|nr:hypothetical protein K788_0006099 [Paraburkholderia caribensis MBA4]
MRRSQTTDESYRARHQRLQTIAPRSPSIVVATIKQGVEQ